jgi:hypothetical protein
MPDRIPDSTAPIAQFPLVGPAPVPPSDARSKALLVQHAVSRRVARPGPVEVWIGVGAFLLYLPTAARALKLGPDVIEYLDIGRPRRVGSATTISLAS